MQNATLICSALHQARNGRRRWDKDGVWHRRIICSLGRRLSKWWLQPDMGQWKMANDIEDQSWHCEEVVLVHDPRLGRDFGGVPS